MPSVRIDKWLWAARFFKTRSLAARACELGRVQSNKQPVKPAREVHAGDFLEIKTEGGEFEVEDMPVTVAVDAEGNSIHQIGPAQWRKSPAREAVPA